MFLDKETDLEVLEKLPRLSVESEKSYHQITAILVN